MSRFARWVAGALLLAVFPAQADDIVLFDGKTVATVVYDQTGGAPIAPHVSHCFASATRRGCLAFDEAPKAYGPVPETRISQ